MVLRLAMGGAALELSRGCLNVPKWFLPTVSEVLGVKVDKALEVLNGGKDASQILASRRKAEGFWRSALATLSSLLHPHQHTPTLKGLILCGPAPIFSDPAILTNYSTWIFTPTDAKFLPLLPPATWLPSQPLPHCLESSALTPQAIKLVANDPLINEKFCLVLTAEFSLAMVVGENPSGEVTFEYSFEPEAIKMVWQALQARVRLADIGERACHLDALVEKFPIVAPSYKTVMQFGQLLVKNLPDWEEKENLRVPWRALPSQKSANGRARYLTNQIEKLYGHGKLNKNAVKDKGKEPTQLRDVELLQAFAHEIRTPLTTIRTLTRLLLKRATDPEMLKRLESIDRECTEQIDRFNLIFRAVEMETSETRRTPIHLTSTPLAQIFNSCIPRWQKQASRRNLTLEVLLPPKMPSVVSDPTMLDQVLTGAIENFTASQPPGGHIQVEVTLAGNQLKVQLQCQLANKGHAQNADNKWPTLKSLGNLLMFQPETGNISLNLSVTKNLFQALGGKLIVRQRPQQGNVLTIYLPLETESTDFYRPGSSGNIYFV